MNINHSDEPLKITRSERRQLRRLMIDAFNLSEIKALSFDLGIRYEDIAGAILSEKVLHLIEVAERQGLLESLLQAVRRERPLQPWPDGRHFDLPPCPYKGLAAFEEEDSGVFFGRESVIDQLVQMVEEIPLVAVVGPSGSGKSSLVNAGLIAQLTRDPTWLILKMRPGERPYRALGALFTDHLESNLGERSRLKEIQAFSDDLVSGELRLGDVFDRILEKTPKAQKILLVIDQFEELFTLVRNETLRPEHFIDLLLENGHEVVSLVLTLRADFMGQALLHRQLADQLRAGNLLLGPMSREALQSAIEKPAALAEVRFEEGLVERILDDVGLESGNLPLLEFALEKLWERQTAHGVLTHVGYEQIERVEGALANYADDVLDGLPAEKQDALPHIFVQLVQPGLGTEDTRRIATRDNLAQYWEVVKQVADERLIVTNQNEAGEETAEVVHEALIQHWEQLKEWIEVEREFRTWQEKFRQAMIVWNDNGQSSDFVLRSGQLDEADYWLSERSISLDEQLFFDESVVERNKRERLTKRIIWGGVAIILALVTLTVFSISTTLNARRESRFAISGELGARSERILSQNPILAQQMAIEAITTTFTSDGETTFTARDALYQVLNQPLKEGLVFGHTSSVNSAEFSPDGNRIVTASRDATARLWDGDGNPIAVLEGHTDIVNSAVFSPDGNRIVTTSIDATARLWDGDGNPIAILEGHTSDVNSAEFSPDGNRIVTASLDATARLWDGDGNPIAVLEGHTDSVNSAEFSPDGNRIVTASWDDTARLWNGDGIPIAVLEGHTLGVNSAEFSPDGNRIVTASWDTARLWDGDGNPIAILEGHTGAVNSAEFSLDGNRIIASTSDTAQLWDGDGNPIAVLEGHTGAVNSAEFSPDGNRIVTASRDDTARLWNGGENIEKLLAEAMRRANLEQCNVSDAEC